MHWEFMSITTVKQLQIETQMQLAEAAPAVKQLRRLRCCDARAFVNLFTVLG